MTSSTAKGQLSRLAVRSGSTIATAARSLSFHWPDTTSSRLDSQWRCEDGGGGRRRAAMSVLLRVALRLRFGSRWFPFSLVLPFLSPLLSFAGALLLLLRLQRRLLRKADDVVHVVLRRDGVRTRRRRVDAWRGAVFVGGGEFGEGGQGVGEVGRRGWRVGRRAQLVVVGEVVAAASAIGHADFLKENTQRRLELPVRGLEQLAGLFAGASGRQHELVDHHLLA